MKQQLYIHVNAARHFLQWELSYFEKSFEVITSPQPNAALLAIGPDVMQEASTLPASKRFLIQYPGFGHNPLHDLTTRRRDIALFNEAYDTVFVNPGPLEVAYAEYENLVIYPPCVDTTKVHPRYRSSLNSLIHVSSRTAQKDWQRSASIMIKTGLKNEVFPPRDPIYLRKQWQTSRRKASLLSTLRIPHDPPLPLGYVSHKSTISKYLEYDGFVHVARDVAHPSMIDGKYTATVMEAALTGAIVFWHDTLGLGNSFETVFNLPLETNKAAERILDIRDSIDIERHSRLTREEFLDKVSPQRSTSLRINAMCERLELKGR